MSRWPATDGNDGSAVNSDGTTEVLFRTQKCNKTGREISFNVSKHCPAAASILLKVYDYAEKQCGGYLFPVVCIAVLARGARRRAFPRAEDG